MQQLRRDPVTGRWIIVHHDAEKKPKDYIAELKKFPAKPEGKVCPFCPGGEDRTPPEIYVDRPPSSSANQPGWNLRVIANKFPALRVEGDLDSQGNGMYDRMNGVGAHEVIIEHPDHRITMADMSDQEVERIILAFKHRCVDLKRDRRFVFTLVFKNHGESAGASLAHTHSQLIALPIVPKKMQEMLRGAEHYYQFRERCVYCDIIRQEQGQKDRVVEENERFLCFTPFASCSPFEMWIIPKQHSSQFYHIREEDIASLAQLLRRTLARLKKTLTDPPFNFIINTSPIQHDKELDYFHWYIEIVPKLTPSAGFEWGTGFYINPTPPEKAAAWLRNAKLKA